MQLLLARVGIAALHESRSGTTLTSFCAAATPSATAGITDRKSEAKSCHDAHLTISMTMFLGSSASERPTVSLSEPFEDGQGLLRVVEQRGLEGVVSKRSDASGECRDWREVKTAAWREDNRERRRLFKRP
jgi:hypothetical protein